MDHGVGRCRLVGDYILGPKIGSGSFAVVWRSRHRYHGFEVAIKEIDRKQLSNKVNDNLLKEITILRQIKHPNIIRLHDAIQTADKIYLVLEYCNGGDLAAYIQRIGRLSEAGARHFMRQLASGLQVLRENNLIHRDLKPQNLLLSTNYETPVLKIGDFGFARYLKPQGLADTLCGSPLYMAPEIIQNQKYDAKADLWSVGAILFQLATGKPPFDGNNQFQLFQNVTCNELEFPRGVIEELHPDCVDLCKSLLRRNPVERLTFEEFFNHKFLAEQRPMVEAGCSSLLLEGRTPVQHRERLVDDKILFTSDKEPQEQLSGSVYSSNICSKSVSCSSVSNEKIFTQKKELDRSTLGNKKLQSETAEDVHAGEKTGCVDQGLPGMNTSKVVDSLDFIDQEYVLVNAHFTSTETLSFSLEASAQDQSAAILAEHSLKKTGKAIAASTHTGDLATSSVSGAESLGSHESAPLAPSQASMESLEVPELLSLHPSVRLRLLHQYVHALSELAKEKLDAGLHLESFSVELVALAVWKQALCLCNCWVSSASGVDSRQSALGNECSDQEGARLSLSLEDGPDFDRPASICSWFEQGFLVAFDRVERFSSHLRDMDANIEMPDAIELIFQAALTAGKRGAVDELIRNWSSAAASYSKAAVLLSFILAEATSLPLSPPFSLSLCDGQRLHRYIINLQAHLNQSLMSQASTKQTPGIPNK